MRFGRDSIPFFNKVFLPPSNMTGRQIYFFCNVFFLCLNVVPFPPTVKAQRDEGDLVNKELDYSTGPLTKTTYFRIKPRRGLMGLDDPSFIAQVMGREKIMATTEESLLKH